MINERQYVKEAIYDWVAAVVAESGRLDPVVYDNGKGPRPSPPFVSLEFTGGQTPGTPHYGMVKVSDDAPDSAGIQKITQPVRKAMTMHGFGESAIDLLETIKASIWREKYIEMLGNKGLVIPDALDVTENPNTRSNETENAAFFEFYVTYMRIIEDNPGWIETVEIASDTPVGNITNKMEEVNG